MEHYEDLRTRALSDQESDSRLGLAVLRHGGMAAWMEAWATLRPATTPAPRNGDQARACLAVALPESCSGTVVQVLAAMALSHLREAGV